MDIERTMQFILEQQAKAEAEMAVLRQWLAEQAVRQAEQAVRQAEQAVRQAEQQAEQAERHAGWQAEQAERHAAWQAEQAERHAGWQAEFEARSAQSRAQADRDFAAMREILSDTMLVQREQGRILVQIDVKLEQLGGRVDQLAVAQLVTEQKLQGLIAALERGTNGKH